MSRSAGNCGRLSLLLGAIRPTPPANSPPSGRLAISTNHDSTTWHSSDPSTPAARSPPDRTEPDPRRLRQLRPRTDHGAWRCEAGTVDGRCAHPPRARPDEPAPRRADRRRGGGPTRTAPTRIRAPTVCERHRRLLELWRRGAPHRAAPAAPHG